LEPQVDIPVIRLAVFLGPEAVNGGVFMAQPDNGQREDATGLHPAFPAGLLQPLLRVDARMLLACSQFEVLDSIVALVAVDMVYKLIRVKCSAKVSTHYYPVFQPHLAVMVASIYLLVPHTGTILQRCNIAQVLFYAFYS
jgi:hypothetical protein